jgi:hypothetical protein
MASGLRRSRSIDCRQASARFGVWSRATKSGLDIRHFAEQDFPQNLWRFSLWNEIPHHSHFN